MAVDKINGLCDNYLGNHCPKNASQKNNKENGFGALNAFGTWVSILPTYIELLLIGVIHREREAAEINYSERTVGGKHSSESWPRDL